MKSLIAGLSGFCIAALVPIAAFAEAREIPHRGQPLLRIETYDTGKGKGTASVSYFFGRPITGNLRFRTTGERDTRKEGFAKRSGEK